MKNTQTQDNSTEARTPADVKVAPQAAPATQPLDVVLNRIQIDSHTQPDKYLDEVEVPGGGE